MTDFIDFSLIDWSRAQFALTAMYHWIFVPLTLGLAVIMALMETQYVRTGQEHWRRTARFWMRLFGVNFAVGVATGLILEFEFGTNWSNYSWFVGDIFGAPLAIEGIVAFFMEATFIAVMYFGWEKVGRKFHLASTWLTGLGATISAWWILVANSWMQHPVGMEFNPDTVRNEMVDFMAVALSPVAVSKFFHTVLSGWVVGAAFVVGVSAWYLLRKREVSFALDSFRVGAVFGLVSAILVALTGDVSGVQMAREQPMKLAAAEGLEQGGRGVAFTLVGDVKIPYMLSLLATHDIDGYVPGIQDLLEGGYPLPGGGEAMPVAEKMVRGQRAITALANYRQARQAHDETAAAEARRALELNVDYLGYGYIKDPARLVPPLGLTFWSFRVMVGLGGYFILFFAVALWLLRRGSLAQTRWMLWAALCTIPLAYIAGQAGWVVAEVGRQPWAIQDMLPVEAAISRLSTGTVQLTFFLFLVLFTVMLAAEVNILCRMIRKGPEPLDGPRA